MSTCEPKLSDFLAAAGYTLDAPAAAGPRGVARSDDFERIDALPRRANASFDVVGWSGVLTMHLRADGGTMHLRPVQVRALYEASEQGGLLAPIGVGRGKTLITLLLPTVLDSHRAVILTAPSLVPQLMRDMDALSQHWRIRRDAITVVPYSRLSVASGADLLERLAPDLVIADEVHHLRHASAARTKRFLRYFAAHPDTRFCALSGTITSRSLRDYAHLATLALREGAPVPQHARTLDDWCAALDEGVEDYKRLAPGALAAWCAPGETARDGVRRRVVETPGVVATVDSAVPNGLEIHARGLKSATIAAALRELYATGCAPSGAELADGKDIARVARQLACGFFYRWVWPHNEPDLAWLTARNAWNSTVRWTLEREDRAGYDSPLLLAQAAERGDGSDAILAAWTDWRAVRERPEPPVEPVWLCEDFVRDVARWAREPANARGLIWYEHAALGERLARELGCPLYGAGTDIPPGDAHLAVASIRAHGTGRNLQAWDRNLVTTPPSSGAAWEQLLGRTHREGQTADVVHVEVYQHAEALRAAVAQARRDADYIAASTGQPQKLGLATWVGFEASDAQGARS